MILTVILTVITVLAVFVTGIKDEKVVKNIIQTVSQQGITVVIALVAITVACISYQDSKKREENKEVYLNYLALMFTLIIFMQAISLFIYLKVFSQWYLWIFSSYFVLGILLITMALVETFKIVKMTFK